MGDEKITPNDTDDAEGHAIYARSDAAVKSGVAELPEEDEPVDDTEGHAAKPGR